MVVDFKKRLIFKPVITLLAFMHLDYVCLATLHIVQNKPPKIVTNISHLKNNLSMELSVITSTNTVEEMLDQLKLAADISLAAYGLDWEGANPILKEVLHDDEKRYAYICPAFHFSRYRIKTT